MLGASATEILWKNTKLMVVGFSSQCSVQLEG